MKQYKHFILKGCILAVLLLVMAGCKDSGSTPQTEIVEAQSLGVYNREEPVELAQCSYRTSASQSSYATFTLAENATIGYMMSNGTVEIYDTKDSLVFADIFYPTDNGYKTVSLDSGQYLIKIQNTVNEDSSFGIFSEELGLDCTTVRSSEDIIIAPNSNEFIAIQIERNQVSLQATFPTDAITLFDSNFVELTPASDVISTSLKNGSYILLVDNSDSQASGTLKIVIQ